MQPSVPRSRHCLLRVTADIQSISVVVYACHSATEYNANVEIIIVMRVICNGKYEKEIPKDDHEER